MFANNIHQRENLIKQIKQKSNSGTENYNNQINNLLCRLRSQFEQKVKTVNLKTQLLLKNEGKIEMFPNKTKFAVR